MKRSIHHRGMAKRGGWRRVVILLLLSLPLLLLLLLSAERRVLIASESRLLRLVTARGTLIGVSGSLISDLALVFEFSLLSPSMRKCDIDVVSLRFSHSIDVIGRHACAWLKCLVKLVG
jgi:hypothetical protein